MAHCNMYDKVLEVLRQPTADRKDFEINSVLPWFRKKSDLFSKLKTGFLVDIIKCCSLETRERDDILIKQGDRGDCFYICLSGKVTIYINYANKEEKQQRATDDADGEEDTKIVTQHPKKVTDRSKLGTFVITLGAGATFGEVALITEDSVRTASIVCDEHTDVIVIDRNLYNRSVKYVLEKEFEEKTNFIKSNPFFQNWAPKYKKQLAMAFETIKFPYESAIIKQGNHVDAIYFILRGEVKMVVDTTMHHVQYPKLCPHEDAALDTHNGTSPGSPSIHRRVMSGESTGSDSPNLSIYRRKIGKKPLVDVCYLGVNECIGDTEVLLEMPTFFHSAICTQETEVLMLETKHYERLLVKRNPQAITAMTDSLELKLQHRINEKVLLSQLLYHKTKEINDEVRRQSQARRVDHKKHPKAHIGSDAFIPTTGPLVDMYGPGTVFHRIRQREHSKQAKLKKDRESGHN
ncbi:unnamed protein product [Owenia fusiformis]|uniref:Cyclic nucleotide-binding domain-containing protein n=1 Tax=Owenia fusiformis TaxID=6347 RepID=A0A8S4NM84_OWEFU|nr:unnamed protein product [Owenia fusiformis]